MTRNDSAWINEMFFQRTRDVAPAAAREAACVLYAPVSSDLEASRRCASILPDYERERSERFLTKELKTHFEQRRAFRRYCATLAVGAQGSVSRIDFAEKENGRPYLLDFPDLWFSFSSSRFGFLGAWSSTHAIGVDLEDKTRNVEPGDLAQHFFSEAEAKAVESARGQARLRTFFQLWCLKEAALKSIGEGLPFGLDAFEFEVSPKIRMIGAPNDYGGQKQFDAHMIEGTPTGRGCAALVVRKRATLAA